METKIVKVKGKWLYFADDCGVLEKEAKMIEDELKSNGIEVKLKVISNPPWNENYDVIFFDWGGMSVGNSMLEHFCEYFIEQAKNNPSRIYVMTSDFTKRAMEDAISYLDREIDEQPKNIFLTIKSSIQLLKEWYGN